MAFPDPHGMVDAMADETSTAFDLADRAALRTVYRDPHPAVADKHRPVIDDASAAFIASSPFFVLATTSDGGTDASPRGGPPGFVTVLDPRRIAFGDLAGNNRLDSYTNIVDHGEVGLLFLVPGRTETLRVNGRASVTTDPAVLDVALIDGKRPKVAVVVEVAECFIHCAKALRRSSLWDPESWLPADQTPTAGEIIAKAWDLDVDPGLIDADLEQGYEATMWVEGGT
ncbi:MSMEG_1061 family FMN-dependent PPOX-type flavoprotein [Aquihabitans daechungensis]|uniref:MSMEG_1061 family FMN-dependent PPOX-type flavoprotein n=1 Tax=Aquihabitans daechungensis TaxID=1052257 RepID=UPI003BA05A97